MFAIVFVYVLCFSHNKKKNIKATTGFEPMTHKGIREKRAFFSQIRPYDVFFSAYYVPSCRRGGLMFSARDSGSSRPGSSPGRGTALCSWAKHFPFTVPLSTLVFK